MIKQSPKDYTNLLIIGTIILIVVLILWPIFMSLTTYSRSLQEQLILISDNLQLYVINFVIASLISPLFAFVLVMFVLSLNKEKLYGHYSLVFGFILLAMYVVFSSVSYLSQVFVFASLIQNEHFAQAPIVYFNNVNSIAYIINQLGYVFFASSVSIFGFVLLFKKGCIKNYRSYDVDFCTSFLYSVCWSFI